MPPPNRNDFKSVKEYKIALKQWKKIFKEAEKDKYKQY